MNDEDIKAFLEENARRAREGEELLPFPDQGPVDEDGDPVAG